MKVFISHNRSDKVTARLLAILMAEQGTDVWFDEWEIKPGDSITGGIEKGLSEADVFVLVWSAHASNSKWVGTEVRSYLHRRVDNDNLKIIPVVVDRTQLPTLVADYRGFYLDDHTKLENVVLEITGQQSDKEVAHLLQRRLKVIIDRNLDPDDPIDTFICPKCGCDELEYSSAVDHDHDEVYRFVNCKACGWGDSTV